MIGSQIMIHPFLKWMSTTSYALLGTFSFVSIVGNGFVFWAMTVDKRLRTNSNLFILSLALSDFLMGCISIPIYLLLHISEENVLGDVMCSITAFLDNTLVIVSMWTLLLTSLDRFLLIVYQKIYHDVLNRRNTILMILAVWSYAVVIAGLPLVGWNRYEYTGNTCSIADQNHPYFRTFFFLTFPIPLIITATCYIWIAVKTNKVHHKAQSHNKKKFQFSQSANQLRRTGTTDKVARVTTMVLVLVLAHVVLTLPAFTINLITTFQIAHINDHFEGVANDVVILMFFANAAVNPILYGVFNTNFQAAFEFCPCKKLTSPGINPSHHSVKNSSMRSPSPHSVTIAQIMPSPSPNVERKELTAETSLNTHERLSRNCTKCDDAEIHSNNLNVPAV